MNKADLPAAVYLHAAACTRTQNGTVQVAFIPLKEVQLMFLKFADSFLKSGNPLCWFTNPHIGDRYPPAFITINERKPITINK